MPFACTSIGCDVTALVVTILTLGQFVPQHVQMATDQSVEGVSPWLLFFNSLYTYLAVVDLVLQHPIRYDGPGLYRYFIFLQPYIQMIGSALLSAAMWGWYLHFAQTHHMGNEAIEDMRLPPSEKRVLQKVAPKMKAVSVFWLFLLLCVGVSVIAAMLSMAGMTLLAKRFGYVCGIVAAVVNMFMWLPQIMMTAASGEKGSLSTQWVTATLIMDVTYAIYLAVLRFHWTVWLNNIPDAVLSGILLGMIIRFDYRDKRRRQLDRQVDEAEGAVVRNNPCTLVYVGNAICAEEHIPLIGGHGKGKGDSRKGDIS